MIYIVEIPHQLPPKVWSRADKDQVISAIDEASARSGDTIYEKTTGRALLDTYGYDSTNEMREDNDALTGLADQIDAHGLSTPLYKGFGDDGYDIEPVSEWESYLQWNGYDLSTQRVYMSGDEARAALADDSEWHIHQGVEARIALKRELKTFGE